jgi:hypothetical protein
MDGRFYFNTHTSLNSGGEIRGQLVMVPEPSVTVLLLAGLVGLGTVCRRHQRRRRNTGDGM